jgi:hypothetical protein
VAAWAAQHPSLRRLGLCNGEIPEQDCDPALTDLQQQVARLRPQASLEVCDGTEMLVEFVSF